MSNENQHKKVFFLGAGFSKAVNISYPLLKVVSDKSGYPILGLTELTLNAIHNNLNYSPSLKKHLNEVPEALLSNIEELLTFLNTDLPWKDSIQKKQDEALYEALTKEIAKTIKNIDDSSMPMGLFKPETKDIDVTQLVQHINANKYPVITLNYDTLFEDLTLKMNKVKLSDLYQIPITDIQTRLGQGSLANWNDNIIKCSHLVKLHGSINWFFSKMDNRLFYEYKLPKNLQYLKEDLVPYIIPPVLDKNNLYNHQLIKSLWTKAHNYIKEAEEIYIIGFSLPPTDTSVKFLFQSALRDAGRKKIYFINTDKEKKLSENFKFFKPHQLDYTYCDMDYPLEEFINKKIFKINSEIAKK